MANKREAAGLILESAFTSVTDINSLKIPKLLFKYDNVFDNRTELMKIEYKLKVLLIHGASDWLIWSKHA